MTNSMTQTLECPPAGIEYVQVHFADNAVNMFGAPLRPMNLCQVRPGFFAPEGCSWIEETVHEWGWWISPYAGKVVGWEAS